MREAAKEIFAIAVAGLMVGSMMGYFYSLPKEEKNFLCSTSKFGIPGILCGFRHYYLNTMEYKNTNNKNIEKSN